MRQGAEVDPNDPIMRAMMAEMAAPNIGPPITMPPVGTPPYRSTDVSPTFVAPAHPILQNNSALADVFGDDEDELPQRQLVCSLICLIYFFASVFAIYEVQDYLWTD